MTKYKYNSYPLGKVPKELQRPEIDKLKELGYEFNDAREIIDLFENKVAKFAGSKYAVSVDCCSHGVFLGLKYILSLENSTNLYDFYGASGTYPQIDLIIPKQTYVSIPMQIMHAGFGVQYENLEWSGIYQIKPTRVWDGAVRWTKGMYIGGDALQVISFQFKKRVPIGKGGMILTDDENAYKMLKLMSYDGRDLTLPYDHPEHVKTLGYHMYMTPEDAARGIILMDSLPEENEDSGNNTMYPDVEIMMKNI